MIKQILLEKANYFIVGLFVLISIFFSDLTYADNKQDIAELEAFYHLVFDENSTTNTSTKSQPAKTKNKTLRNIPKNKITPLIKKAATNIFPGVSKQQPTKQALRNTKIPTGEDSKQNIDDKDPELVAFYENIFGRKTTKPDVKVIPHSSINKSVTPVKLEKASRKQHIPVIKQPAKSIKKLTSSSVDNNVAAVKKDEPADNIAEQKTGLLDNNLLSSQVRKTNKKDTLALFEKAFGKKQKKTTRSKSSKTGRTSATNASVNDMSSLFAKAFGTKTAKVVPSNVTVDLRVNSSTIGEVKLFSNNSGTIDQVSTENLLTLLEDVLKDPVFKKVEQQFTKTKRTLLSDLEELGIATFYNSTNLSLDLEVKPELRKPQVLSLLRKKKASVREENIIEAEKVSGYLNAFSNIGLSSYNTEADLRMRIEGSLNIGSAVLESTGDYRNDQFDIGLTTLTYDRPEKLQRFRLGNISTGARNFQENLELDGIRFSKEYFLDPDLQISPRANEPLQIYTDSEVELYVNNQLLRRFHLKAGVYALQDIGLYNGANNIRIRIKDEFGKVTVKTSQQYYDSNLLKPGLSLFAISVGYLSNQQSSSNYKLEKSPILSGYYQKGLSKELTLSLDAQLSSESYLLGAETISSLSIGSLQNSIALSGGKDRNTGFASSFEFRPYQKQAQISLETLRKDLLGIDTRSRGLINSWSVSGEYRSEDFLLLNSINQGLTDTSQDINGTSFSNKVFNDNKLRSNIQTNFNLNINDNWRGSLNVGMADYYGAEDSYYANLSANRRFNNGIRLSLGTRYDTEDKFSMNLQLSIPLSRKKGKKRVDLNLLTDSRDNSYESKLSVKPSGFLGKNSLAGSLKHYENKTSRQENLDLHYRNTQFESTLTASHNYDKSSKNKSQQFNLGFNTAIACVGSSCASTYPINDSFAIVTGPSNQTNPIALSNNKTRFHYSDVNDTGLPDNYSGLISGKGKKAVVQLNSYSTQNINVDEGTLPNGYDTEKTEFSIFPKYHQGFLLKAGGEPATSIDGMLYDDNNQVLGFKGGQWVPVNTGKTVAFFSNKGGRFRVMSIPAGKYKLELFDYPDMEPITVSIPDTKGKTHNMGKLIIKKPNQ